MKSIKKFSSALNFTTEDKVSIIIPEKITFSFTGFEGENEYNPPEDERAEIIEEIVNFTKAKDKIIEAKGNNIVALEPTNKVSKRNITYLPLLQFFGKRKVVVRDADIFINTKITELT